MLKNQIKKPPPTKNENRSTNRRQVNEMDWGEVI